MSHKYYNKMMEIANLFAKIPGLKKILKPLYYPLKEYINKNNNSKFRKNALSIISEFTSCLDSHNISYTVAFGTLLGAIREKGFIKHDLDIDLAIWHDNRPKNLQEILRKEGFMLSHSFLVENGEKGLEETYSKNGVNIDIFYFFPPINELPYCCDFLAFKDSPTFNASMKKYGKVLARRIEMPMVRERILVDFENLKLYAPANAHELLSFRYGPDYMIPNPKWTITSFDNHIIRWENVIATYTE